MDFSFRITEIREIIRWSYIKIYFKKLTHVKGGSGFFGVVTIIQCLVFLGTPGNILRFLFHLTEFRDIPFCEN
ncbi:MAG: hypothetical protein AMDU1_APLC00030G0036 [Thermoplasmatales archaeon A-plasma]|nr:MAG: hypothetical protein AMDU1_APLC00030G0036 [Thermoplasmatales archaeon A-plasma]